MEINDLKNNPNRYVVECWDSLPNYIWMFTNIVYKDRRRVLTSSHYIEMKLKYPRSQSESVQKWSPSIQALNQSGVSFRLKQMNTFDIFQCDKNYLKWQKPSSGKMYLTFTLSSLVHVPTTNMEEAQLMPHTAASHQVAIKLFQPHFWRSCHVVHLCIKSTGVHCIGFLARWFLFYINIRHF